MQRLPSILAGAAALCLICGCGYVGEPLPPLLNIPARVTDLAAVERGSTIIAQFSMPRLTTEGTVIKRPATVELFAGAAGTGTFDEKAWAAQAHNLGNGVIENGRVRYQFPASEWTGQKLVLAARVTGANGRQAGWSNFAVVQVLPPLATPSNLKAQAVPEGVHLTWKGADAQYRVMRLAGDEPSFSTVATAAKPEWTDTRTQYGKTYQYLVQGVETTAAGVVESDLSPIVRITPEDRFPPAVPSGLTAIASTSSIELTWDRDSEGDLAGYRVYRARGNGAFEKIGETAEAPSYSDRKIAPGTTYRYSISALDRNGNESKPSAPVQIAAP